MRKLKATMNASGGQRSTKLEGISMSPSSLHIQQVSPGAVGSCTDLPSYVNDSSICRPLKFGWS
jgi:hypothetical protein